MSMRKRPSPVFCLDIGNTSIGYGVFRGRIPRISGQVLENDIPYLINKLTNKEYINPDSYILISSVVPRITHKIKFIFKRLKLNRRTLIVGEGLKVQIKHKYNKINKLGKDRLINIYGATRLYRSPLLILDFGTALTCDYVSAKGVFEGGLIIPGPEIALQALGERAALLPKIAFPRRARGFLGRNTLEGMKLGILQGYGALTDGLVARFRKRYGCRFRVIATGGLAQTLAPYTKSIDLIDPHLTLKSLDLAFLEHLSK